ncbi:MAG: hypothetical protein HC945_00385 [Nitrosarchaeum sp.]|nr:hypothetical protein [Nitrosarchaeum sp.]
MSRWNARADTPTTIIMWIGAIIAVGILTIWYMRTVYPINTETDVIDSNLKTLQLRFGEACISRYYLYEYNPSRIDQGEFTINRTKACIRGRLHKCTTLFCDTNHTETWRMDDLVHISIERANGTFTFTPRYLQ